MAVVIQQDIPTDAEQYDAVSKEVDGDANPPEGMILHSASPNEGGGMHVVDVWESMEARDKFAKERLTPAVEKVIGETPDGPPQLDVYEVHHLVKP
jgi:hypothetical protein